jgi:hypothetical protein
VNSGLTIFLYLRTKFLYAFFNVSEPAICPAYPTLLDSNTLMVFGEN